MADVTIRQVRSPIGRKKRQRATLRSLGLNHIGDSTVRSDSQQLRGMIASVTHLIAVEPEVK